MNGKRSSGDLFLDKDMKGIKKDQRTQKLILILYKGKYTKNLVDFSKERRKIGASKGFKMLEI